MPHLIELEVEACMLGLIILALATGSLMFLLYFEAMLLRELRRATKRRGLLRLIEPTSSNPNACSRR